MELGHGVEAPVYGEFQVFVAVLGLHLAAVRLFLMGLDVGVSQKAGYGLSLNGHVHDQLLFGYPDGGEITVFGVDMV